MPVNEFSWLPTFVTVEDCDKNKTSLGHFTKNMGWEYVRMIFRTGIYFSAFLFVNMLSRANLGIFDSI